MRVRVTSVSVPVRLAACILRISPLPPSFPSLSPPHFPDPFTMLDVAPEDVKPMTELKQEIEAWLQAQKEEAAKQAAALAP